MHLKNKSIIYFSFLLMFLSSSAFSQVNRDTTEIKRKILIGSTITYGIGYSSLYFLWYRKYNLTIFHLFDDSKEWLQMDKAGHIFSAYYLTKYHYNFYRYLRINNKQSLVASNLVSAFLITSMEYLDGISENWGASLSDVAVNIIGISLFTTQEIFLQKEIFTPKLSFHRTSYSNMRPEILGDNYFENFIKDYNGQTYWVSTNIASVFNNNKIPKWLNIAFGYGAEGMVGGSKNPIGFKNIPRYRQYYLSLDIDLSEIETKNKTINTILDYLNFIKIPFPTLEYSQNKIKFHTLYL